MTALANIALIGVLGILALAVMGTLTGFDRWLDERRNRRAQDKFFSGDWADVWESE